MRTFAHLTKLAMLIALAVVVLLLTTVAGLMNYQGLVSGIELLNLENRPLGVDSLVGWVFESLTPDAAFSNWLALVISALIFLGSLFVCHQLFKIANLLLNRNEYRRQGQSEQMWQAVAQEATWLLLLGIPLGLVVWGDVYLFQYRALAGALSVSTPEQAVQLPHWSKLPTETTQAASVTFLQTAGMWMYLGASVLAPFSLEYLLTKMGATWALIVAAISDLMASEAPNDGERNAQQFYGYDADGNPVYDPDSPIAYDVNQQPVVSAPTSTQSSPAGATAPSETANESPAPGNEATGQALQPVVGTQPEERVTLAAALANPDRYHVERATHTIYSRSYWDTLHAQERPSGDESTMKEAA
ncbi:MAG: hypothetical protein K1X67_26705 [Fimbriimonadaceae bacterium]|nr:hypothetical protein [Fimbriimonadaceae bacterium]